ncbi:MAG: Verru_Chthon cassette protein C [Verrucomicrobiales bacterium]|nr:Verru_Chthon cassette protein C [Verrucomicrobiales bacterium]
MSKSLLQNPKRNGFSLIELLISMAILSVIILLMSSMMDTTSKIWMGARDRTTQFRETRLSFEYFSRNLQQATLNTYWDYYYDSTRTNLPPQNMDETPSRHAPNSELHFLTGQTDKLLGDTERYRTHAVFFQAPLGYARNYTDMGNLLNARGFFVEFGDDQNTLPDFLKDRITPRYRYRLKEFRPPGEDNMIYLDANASDKKKPVVLDQWYQPGSDLYRGRAPYHELVRTVADNVVALIISPRWSEKEAKSRKLNPEDLAPEYRYDSNPSPPTDWTDPAKHQLPPLIKVVFVTISEKSARYLQDRHGSKPPPELEIEAGLFEQAGKLEKDLARFEKHLQESKMEYRIFQSILKLQGAKWTDVQR